MGHRVAPRFHGRPGHNEQVTTSERAGESVSEPRGFALGDLILGVATASLQIEGGNRNNSWYEWATSGKVIRDWSTPLRATDHWNRWREDTELLFDMGLTAYRMSVEWARIEPEPGVFDDEVIARYRQEINALLDRGIRPLVTLHHFSNPTWFQADGEFTRPQSVAAFLRFVRYVVRHLGDIVQDWVTFNEPNVYALEAHMFGEAPPADASWRAVRAAMRHMAEAHCLAYGIIHDLAEKSGWPRPNVGFAHHMRIFAPLNPHNVAHRRLTGVNEKLFQVDIAEAMLSGRFPRSLGQPKTVEPGRYYDYLGLNYYSRTAVSKMDDGTFPDVPVNDLGWEVFPQGLAECATWLHERFPGPIWVTENGTCDNGVDGAANAGTYPGDDAVERFRERFIVEHLRVVAESDLPFERFYHWCFVDNWEWRHGEKPRFGLVHLDYETQERTVKPSGRLYARIAQERRVADEVAASVAAQEYPRSPW